MHLNPERAHAIIHTLNDNNLTRKILLFCKLFACGLPFMSHFMVKTMHTAHFRCTLKYNHTKCICPTTCTHWNYNKVWRDVTLFFLSTFNESHSREQQKNFWTLKCNFWKPFKNVKFNFIFWFTQKESIFKQ